jgi:transposase
VFTDEQFAAAFGRRGAPAESPGRLALVTVLQFAEDLTDRQAAEAVRGRIDWKYLLGLELDDPGFDYSVLSKFRARVAEHDLEETALDVLLAAVKDKGLITAKGKQRSDSTHVLGAVRELNRLELAGECVRAALEAISAAAPGWVEQVLEVSGWAERYGARIDSWRLPSSAAKREQLAIAYGADGYALIAAIYAPFSPAWLRQLPAVQVLRIMLIQNYTRTTGRNGREVVKRRRPLDDGGEGLPPGKARLASPYESAFCELMSLSSLGLGEVGCSEAHRSGYGRGWVNNPGSVSTRMPRPARRLSLARTFWMSLRVRGRSMARARSRARREPPTWLKAVRICW